MSIGTGIVLFVIGAVLAFAVKIQLDWIDLSMVGYLFMGAGAVVFAIGMIFMLRKRKSVTTMHTDQAGGSATTERRTSVTPDEMP
jgi:Domain of unknown function (DUF6458)